MARYSKPILPENITLADKKRLESKVIKMDPATTKGCWEWQGPLGQSGYGTFWLDGNERAHMVSFVMYHQKEIPEGMVIRHKCDNRRCVNPDHLELGTQTENMADMVKRGRGGSTKLTDDKVYGILDAYFNQGKSAYSLAAKLRMGTSTVQAILKGTSWKHVKEKWDADQTSTDGADDGI